MRPCVRSRSGTLSRSRSIQTLSEGATAVRLSCCVADARTRSAPSVRPLAPPRTRSGDQSRSSCLPALPGGPIDVMSEGAVGLDNARVAAWLAQERIRSDARSTNAQYRIPWAATGAGDGADPLQQALVDVQSHFLHVDCLIAVLLTS